jgi:hypothetical protein
MVSPCAFRWLCEGDLRAFRFRGRSFVAAQSRTVSVAPCSCAFRASNVRIVTYGLSNATETFTLFVPSYKGFVYDGLASFKKSHVENWISVFGFDASKLRFDKRTCITQTLDAQGLAPVFMKVDVEGYEYNVLEGGRQTLGSMSLFC